MKSHKGFTLIELLVVIAIIAILAAILFPVFAKAREKARQTVCQSNMKQIALGMQQYTQDYDEFIPPARETIGGTVTPWQVLIQPYVKSTQLFKCPSNQQTGLVDGYNQNGISIPTSYYANAGYQGTKQYGTGGIRPMSDTNSQTIGQIESVSSTILVCERNDKTATSTSSTNDKINDSREVYDTTNGSYLTDHVAGFTGFVFADGHAKMLHPQTTLKPLNMWVVAAQDTTAPSPEWTAAIASADAAMK